MDGLISIAPAGSHRRGRKTPSDRNTTAVSQLDGVKRDRQSAYRAQGHAPLLDVEMPG